MFWAVTGQNSDKPKRRHIGCIQVSAADTFRPPMINALYSVLYHIYIMYSRYVLAADTCVVHTVTRRLAARVNWPPNGGGPQNLGVDWPPTWPPRCIMFYFIIWYCRYISLSENEIKILVDLYQWVLYWLTSNLCHYIADICPDLIHIHTSI